MKVVRGLFSVLKTGMLALIALAAVGGVVTAQPQEKLCRPCPLDSSRQIVPTRCMPQSAG